MAITLRGERVMGYSPSQGRQFIFGWGKDGIASAHNPGIFRGHIWIENINAAATKTVNNEIQWGVVIKVPPKG